MLPILSFHPSSTGDITQLPLHPRLPEKRKILNFQRNTGIYGVKNYITNKLLIIMLDKEILSIAAVEGCFHCSSIDRGDTLR